MKYIKPSTLEREVTVKKLLSVVFTFLIATGLFLTACQPATQQTGANNSSNGQTQSTPIASSQSGAGSQPAGISISKDILLDPALANDPDSQKVNSNLYETLVKMDGDKPVGALAESWRISESMLDYQFTLQNNVTFQDGTPFNADAVVTNFNRWFDPNDPLHGSGDYAAWKENFGGFKGEKDAEGNPVSTFDGIQKIDDYTVLIHLNRPDDKVLTKLADLAFSIASPSLLTANVDNYGSSADTVAGTGPYTVSTWTDQGLSLEPFANYWGTVPTDNINFSFK